MKEAFEICPYGDGWVVQTTENRRRAQAGKTFVSTPGTLVEAETLRDLMNNAYKLGYNRGRSDGIAVFGADA